MTIISRQDWGAKAPKQTPIPMNADQLQRIFIHYTAGPKDQSVAAIQRFHQVTRGWNDIAYNYLVDDAGNIYVGRGWFVVGGHTAGWNSKSHAICWIGTEGEPSDAAKASINYLIQDLRTRVGRDLPVEPHSAVVKTSCPGAALRSWIASGRPVGAVVAPQPAPAPAPAPAPVKYPATIKPGSKNAAVVKQLQTELNDHAKNLGSAKLKVDGDFGPKTEKLLRAFQGAVGLVVDAIVGPKTWAKLLETPR